MGQEDKKEFDFIKEQIKKKPFYRRKWFLQGVTGSILALLFGAVAGISFAVVRPWADEQFGKPDEPTQIVVVQEETEGDLERSSEISGETEAGSVSGDSAEDGNAAAVDGRTETAEEQEKTLNMAQYKEMYQQMKNVADAASVTMVKVSSYTTETDWFNEVYESMSETSGLVLRMDKTRLYVLTSSRVVQDARKIVVTFPNGETAEASIRKQDAATEMAVLEILAKNVTRETRKGIETISVKGVSSVEKGEPVIAVGSPLGYTDSMAFGMITSVSEYQSLDNEYRIITTDIIGNENSYGILLNLDGSIVGIISRKFDPKLECSIVTALGIAEMNYLMEMLMEDQPIPYIGIVARKVDDAAAEQFNMPKGIYVRQVEAESPAMYAGIQVADIITKIDGQRIGTVREYADILRKQREGEMVSVTVSRKGMEGYTSVDIVVPVGER